MRFLLEYLPWFCFERGRNGGAPIPTGFDPSRMWDVLAFATVAASAFVLFVVIGLIRDLVTETGSETNRRRAPVLRVLSVALLGSIAAFLVAIVAIVVDLLQINAQAAVLVGVTWQVVYAKLIAQFQARADSLPTDGDASQIDRQVMVSEPEK